MAVNVGRGLDFTVTQPLLYVLQATALIEQQPCTTMPLRYNYDKPDPPYIEVFRLSGKVFHRFLNRKIEPRSSYIVGGVIERGIIIL